MMNLTEELTEPCTLADEAHEALGLGTALDLRGLLEAWLRATEALEGSGEGEERVRRHAITVLYAERLQQLVDVNRHSTLAAYAECAEMALRGI